MAFFSGCVAGTDSVEATFSNSFRKSFLAMFFLLLQVNLLDS